MKMSRFTRIERGKQGEGHGVQEHTMHGLQWGDAAIEDWSIVEWQSDQYLVETDQCEDGDPTRWLSEHGNRFVACLGRALGEVFKLPSGEWVETEQGYAKLQLVGQISALLVDEAGLLYAEIFTGIVEVMAMGIGTEEARVLYRGVPRTHGFSESPDPEKILLLCTPATQLLYEPVGHVSQLAVIEAGADLDLDVWGSVLS